MGGAEIPRNDPIDPVRRRDWRVGYGAARTLTLPPRPPLRKTLKHILTEYGAVALVVYLTIFFVVLGGFWAAIRFGWRPASVAGNVGTFTAAYIATKLTQPLRIGATVLLTPLVARLYERVFERRATAATDAAGAGAGTPAGGGCSAKHTTRWQRASRN